MLLEQAQVLVLELVLEQRLELMLELMLEWLEAGVSKQPVCNRRQ